MSIIRWLNSQLLKMEWLYDLMALLVENLLGLDMDSKLGGSVHFFLYDAAKIFILLSVLIFGISYIQSFFPPERTKKVLGRFSGILANILAALLGTVTPFCSCSSISQRIYLFREAGGDISLPGAVSSRVDYGP